MLVRAGLYSDNAPPAECTKVATQLILNNNCELNNKRFGTALPPLELLTEHTARELLLLALRLLAQLRGARSQSILDCQEPESRTAKGHVPGLGTLGEAGGAARLEIPAARGRTALNLLRRA